jgi:2-polyprenyl-3-methyl-5-hydroxy-6-metoxy-1,4-benzoquinol methylase
VSIYRGKNGYDSARLWNARSQQALQERGELYVYDTRLDSNDQIFLWLQSEFAKLPSKPDMLEIGAGFGRWAEAFQDTYNSFTGVDIVEARVQHAKELHAHLQRATFQLIGPAWDLGRTFDVVLSITVIQHLLMPEAVDILRSIERHLAPGGVAYLAEWRIPDVSLLEAEALYRKETTPSHMIPKPLGLLRDAVPSLQWTGSEGRFILRRR